MDPVDKELYGNLRVKTVGTLLNVYLHKEYLRIYGGIEQ